MDAIEKELTRKYGSKEIPGGEVVEVLQRAADMRLIDSGDVVDVGAMGVSEVCEYILKARRRYLLGNNELGWEYKTEQDAATVPVEQVLRAYLEYERKTEVNKGVSMKWIPILAVFISLVYYSYTPAPY